jgi:hypothetical protein
MHLKVFHHCVFVVAYTYNNLSFQTASRNVVLKREILLHSSEFWLIAVTENGTASDVHFQESKKLITGSSFSSYISES